MQENIISIHPLTPAEQDFLWEMLYLGLFVPPGEKPLPREIVQQPDIAKYAAEWGNKTDMGLYALDTQSNSEIGAAWLRLFTRENKGYGYVADNTPELSIAVIPERRGQGAGSQLMAELLGIARNRYSAVSLSVTAGNPAVRLYEKFGFVTVKKESYSLVMLKIF